MLQRYHEYDPYLHRTPKFPMTNYEAFTNIVKSAVGVGCLAMPMAFRNAGWLNGIIGTIFVGIIVVYSLHVMFENIYELCKRYHLPRLTYPDAIKIALNEGPKCMRWFSGLASVFVDVFLALFHFGVCCVYVIFIGETVQQVVELYYFKIDKRLFMAAFIVPLIAIFSIRNLKRLVPFSAIANVMLLFGFAVVYYNIFIGLPSLRDRPAFENIERYPLFFGAILFALESIGVMISVEDDMLNPHDFLGLYGILNQGMVVVLFLYTSMGFFGYWRYGDDIKASITLNIPDTDSLSQIVKLMYATAIFFSYPLQGYVIVDTVWTHFISKRIDEDQQKLIEHLVRIAIVLETALIAIHFPDLELVLDLVGSLFLPILGIIFPAILDICVKYKTGYGPWKVHLIRDIILSLFGLFGGALSTLVAAASLIEAYPDFL